ncbi:MAG: outer membrane beta-barrel protein [Leeuwenhoekiella sp.]
MRKFLLAFTFISLFASASAQNVQFGLTAGFTNIDLKVKDGTNDDFSLSQAESGFYVGALLDIAIADNFNVQPEVLYARVEDANFIYIPVLAKLYIQESGFHVLAGPQANLFIDDVGEGINTFGLDISFGAGYDITEHFFVDARYSFEVTNRITNEARDFAGANDASLRANTLNIGVGYKFQ